MFYRVLMPLTISSILNEYLLYFIRYAFCRYHPYSRVLSRAVLQKSNGGRAQSVYPTMLISLTLYLCIYDYRGWMLVAIAHCSKCATILSGLYFQSTARGCRLVLPLRSGTYKRRQVGCCLRTVRPILVLLHPGSRIITVPAG